MVISGVTSLSASLVQLFVIRALIAIIEPIREATTSRCTILHAHTKLCIDTLASGGNAFDFCSVGAWFQDRYRLL